MNDPVRDRPVHDDAPGQPPPLLGSWRNLYIAVVVELAVLVAIFHVLTRLAS